MKAAIDKEGCIGCGLCVATCPELFAMGDDQRAEVMLAPVPPHLEDCARKAADTCPVSVISVTE